MGADGQSDGHHRDGSKLSQPLNSVADADDAISATLALELEADDTVPTPEEKAPAVQVAEKIVHRYISQRRKLPNRRGGYTQKAQVGEPQGLPRTGEYEDGTIGEIFIDMHREGAAMRSILNCFAIATSIGLQYGVPLEEYVDAFTFTRFDPSGMVTGHDHIKMATSVIDYIFRELGLAYLGRTDLVHVKPGGDLRRHRERWRTTRRRYRLHRRLRRRQQWAPRQHLLRARVQRLQLRNVQQGRGRRRGVQGRARLAAPRRVRREPRHRGRRGARASAIARRKGYEGDPCSECGNFTLVRNGACMKCDTCGSTSGCS